MNPPSEMTPERAWQAAITQLRMEMPAAAFDTWVKPASLIAFQGDTFVVGCINRFGRDWLANRLTHSLERLLQGLLNRPIRVRFELTESEEEAGHHPEEGHWPATSFALDIRHNSLRHTLLEPERVVRLPVYYFRWLPYVGAQTVFLFMALWQEYYLTTQGKGTSGNAKVAARAERVCQWAGLSRAQFFRLIQPGSPLGWFARKLETDHEIDRQTGRAKKSANIYLLYETPLTPGDAADLKAYLIAHDIQQSPVTALQAALAADPKAILRYPVRQPPEDFAQAPPRHLTVQHIVRELVGHRLDGDLTALTDQLAERLTATGEFVLMSWYFLKHWLPRLGPDLAMFIVLLRHLCYFNDETGEIRDEVWIKGGYPAIASRLGLANPRVVATWLPPARAYTRTIRGISTATETEYHRRQGVQKLLGLFVHRIDQRANPNGHYDWKFKVQRVDPLLPAHETVLSAVQSLLDRAVENGAGQELKDWCETLKTDERIVCRLSNWLNGCSETLKTAVKDCLATLDLADKDCFETLLKILTSLKNTEMNRDTSSTQDTRDGPAVGAVVDEVGNWSLDVLLRRADRKVQVAMLAEEKNAVPFVSWILYGVSQSHIHNPYSLAIATLREKPRVGAGGASERLAALPPQHLIALIEQQLSHGFTSSRDWQLLLGQAKSDRIRLLADALGIEPELADDR